MAISRQTHWAVLLYRIAGGLLTDALGWQHAVVAMAIFTLLGALLVAYLLPIQQHFKPQRGLFFHHNRALVKHLQNRTLWLAMLIGGVNFALFVNLYSVMGFRLVAEPYSLPIGIASLIFVCYLAGTLSSKLTANWSQAFLGDSRHDAWRTHQYGRHVDCVD